MDPTYSLADVLVALSDVRASGCLRVDAEQGNALVFLRDGQVYAATVPTERTPLGTRLIRAGVLAEADLAAALDAQNEELLVAWRLGELVVHLGMADRGDVERVVAALLLEDLDVLLSWTITGVRFRPGVKTRQDVTPAVTVPALLDPTWRTLPDPPVYMPVPFVLEPAQHPRTLEYALFGALAAQSTSFDPAPLPEVVDTADVLRQIRGLNQFDDEPDDPGRDDAAETLSYGQDRDVRNLTDLAEQARVAPPRPPRRGFFRRTR